MTAFRNRLLGLAAGTLALSSFSSMACAQTDVLTLGSVSGNLAGGTYDSLYTFTSRTFVNSIGFVGYNGFDNIVDYSYQIGQGSLITVAKANLTATDINGLRWFTLDRTFESSETLRVYEVGTSARTATYSLNSATTGVRYDGWASLNGSRDLSKTNSNLRVSSPSNIAPEPGSFALALTGGAALLGICIRRRRNAA